MGFPPQSPFPAQHERLLLELLPLKNSDAFRNWITSPLVQGSWREFCHDFLARNQSTPEADKDLVAKQATDAIRSRTAKYVAYHPAKNGWTAEDHHIRFIVTVVEDNRLNGGIWTDVDRHSKQLAMARAVYEVLGYLRVMAAVGMDTSPPSYDA
ncbi:hypothetical protein M406DRAFT_328700 [Cryphonectria parasitica EP155]|uniref:Uncharacterized protein n=1 Tax=Cryphonectria parasitica (strain ATCC 38755 / EP155) TaxID=660469 RepID=A0A9P5CRZ9_CRYP1|nr:uncharacterized protein M406DRAFT_328700 [Cryphonectria parasitica EP155]KAF3767630.1 hypothetical protein M406DRAFT_328700 [Cryphonectria parasitica EP155]